ARDVARERVMALGPVAHPGQPGAERAGHDVLGVADEDRSVAYAREALDVLDHLRVVVRRDERLALAAGRHRQEADEVGHPRARSTVVTGSCASHSISNPRRRRRSASAIAMSRQAWPRPIGDEMYSARLGRMRLRFQLFARGGTPATLSANARIRRLTTTGS